MRMVFINDLCADIGPGGLFPLFVSYHIERMSDDKLEKIIDEESMQNFLEEKSEHLLYWQVKLKHA